MSVYTAIIATFLAMKLRHADSAAALKYNGIELDSWLSGHLDKGSVHWRGEPGM